MTLVALKEKDSASTTNIDVPYLVYDDAYAEQTRSALINAGLAQALADQGSAADDYKFKREASYAARVTALYRAGRPQPLTLPAAGQAVYTLYPWTAPRMHVLFGEHVLKVPNDAPDFGGAINVVSVNEAPRGVIVPGGTATDGITYQFPAAVLTQDFINRMRRLRGAVNSVEFFGHPPGTVRFVANSGAQRSDGDQTVSMGFDVRDPEEKNAGSINFGTVSAFDYAWAHSKPHIFTGIAGGVAEFIGPKEEFGYVTRIFRRADLNDLALPDGLLT